MKEMCRNVKMSCFLPFFVSEKLLFFKLYHYTLKISNYLDHGESKNNDNVYMGNVKGIFTYLMPTEYKFFTNDKCSLLSLTKGNQSLSLFINEFSFHTF